MATTKKTTTKVVKKTTTRRKSSSKKTTTKKAYADGLLVFKSKAMLDYHLQLKELKKNGLIQDFEVPTIEEKTKNKHGAIKVMIDGHLFDSTVESKYYIYLLEQVAAGEVKSFSLQPAYELIPRFQKKINGKVKTFRKTEYIADFIVVDKNNEESIIDIKGQLTDVFKLKQKLFEHTFPDKTLRLIKYERGQWKDI